MSVNRPTYNASNPDFGGHPTIEVTPGQCIAIPDIKEQLEAGTKALEAAKNRIAELERLASWALTMLEDHHWRTLDGDELERSYCIECGARSPKDEPGCELANLIEKLRKR